MLTRIARPVEIALGALFIVTAALKALNVYGFAVQVAAYGIVRDPSVAMSVAYVMIGLETLLGVALLAGLQLGGFIIFLTGATLVGFTGLIAYAWAFKGLADCGCFGDFVKVGPGASIVKNLVLLTMTGIVWVGTRGSAKRKPEGEESGSPEPAPGHGGRTGLVLAVIGVAIIAAAFAAGKPAQTTKKISDATPPVESVPDKPFAGFVPDLGGAPVPLAQGTFFLVLLSADCDHCRAVTQSLNDLTQTPGVPQIAVLLLGNEDEVNDYRSVTDPQFPIQVVEPLEFMSLLADGVQSPPDFFIVSDGAIVRHLAAQEPTYEALLEFATKDQAPPAGGQQQ